MSKEQVLSIVRKMPVRLDEVRCIVRYLERATDIGSFNIMNVFNYGYMLGVQAERAKRKKPSTHS